MKNRNRILSVILCVALLFSLSSAFCGVFAQEDPKVENSETSEDDGKFKMDFHPKGFLELTKYMGIGMLGIFIIIGLIAIATIVINKAFSVKPKNE